MKVRLLAVMAVVVVGVMAGTSPAMAKKAHIASAWSHQHADNKAFGEAIHKLRISNDLTNYSVGQITAASVKALTALKDGLANVAAASVNYKYGVMQLGTVEGTWPGAFYATPPLQPTGEQQTVTAIVAAQTAGRLTVFTAVRSADPNDGSTVRCRIGGRNFTSGQNIATRPDGDIPARLIPQSRIKPENKNPAFPFQLIPTEDNALDLASGPEVLAASALTATTMPIAAAGILVSVQLSCIVVPKE